jgi:Putative TM nitroreductase
VKNSVRELIKHRYSCRDYIERPIGDAERAALAAVLASLDIGPFGNRCRPTLLASTPDDRAALKGLGTYGFIKGATGFLLGAVKPGPLDMEDYGYLLERAVLEATDLGLGTCWLGGTFTKSSFARKIDARPDEVVPAVIAAGYPTETSRKHWLRRGAGSERRLPSDKLFFDEEPQTPLDPGTDGDLAAIIEAVRWAPSASNKQPWRLIRKDGAWHFYLARTKGYGKGPLSSLVKMADLQRVDLGIAMCHFELAAREAGMDGRWVADQPLPENAAAGWEYTASWVI